MSSRRLMPLADVTARVGTGRSTVYRLIKEGKFPRQVTVGATRCARWASDEIEAWVDAQVSSRSSS